MPSNDPGRRRVTIIDTDPGLDDALALLLAFRSSDLDITGVTTVCGNLDLPSATRNALRLLALLGRQDVPVAAGAESPLIRAPFQTSGIHGVDGLGGVKLPEPAWPAAEAPAVPFLRSILRDEPSGSVQILALGPLTNIARLIEADAECAARIGRIIVMGGAICEPGNVGPRAEFNIAVDPHAAAIVFASGIPVTLVPIDVTRHLVVDRDWARRLKQAAEPVAEAAASLMESYFASPESAGSRPLHDPCVILRAIAPNLFTAQRMHLRVETEGPDAGALIEDPAGHTIEVLLDVEATRALDLLTQRLAG